MPSCKVLPGFVRVENLPFARAELLGGRPRRSGTCAGGLPILLYFPSSEFLQESFLIVLSRPKSFLNRWPTPRNREDAA